MTESPKAQASASAVLADMTRSSKGIQTMVAKEGAIEPLVALLAAENELEARSEAAGLAWSLASGNSETQSSLAEANVIPLLVKLLEEPSADAQRKASGALASLAIGSASIQESIANAGGIANLIALLSPEHCDEVHAKAAMALAEIARGHPANQSALSDGIIPVVALLKAAGDEAAKEEAASALWSFSMAHPENQKAIAAASGLEPLVALCGYGGDHAQRQAAGALASIGLEQPANTKAMCEMLVRLITASTGKETKTTSTKAARAIMRLARSHPSFQAALRDVGCIEPLVNLLRAVDLSASSASVMRTASSIELGSTPPPSPPKEKTGDTAADSVVEANGQDEGIIPTPPPNKAAGSVSTQLGAASPVMHGSKHERAHLGSLHTEASAALWALARADAANQIGISEAGAVPLLIGLLTASNVEVHRDAAGALWSLADGQQSNQRLIASEGAIAPLIGLLSDCKTGAQESAAGALHSLAALDENRVAIAEAGGIKSLVDIFQAGSEEAKSEAAGALATLVVSNEPNQHAVSQALVKMLVKAPPLSPCALDVTRLLHTLAQGSENRNALSKAGAIDQLAIHLRDGTASGQTMAANALSKIALKSAQHRLQVTQQLITLLGSEVEAVRQRAGTALKAMSADGDGGQHLTVAMAGGIDRFVSLLKDGSVEAQEYTLSLLWQSTDLASKRSIARANCAQHVIAIMENSTRVSSLAQEHASALLARLVVSLPGEEGDALREVNATTIRERGGIAPLVYLLRNGTPGAKRYSSLALAQLALALETSEKAGTIRLSSAIPDAIAQREIAEVGAVSALIEWLEDSALGPPERAAQALATMAQGNPDTQMAIAEEGAISPLIALLDLGREPTKGAEAIEQAHQAQRWAAAAIAALAEGSSANQVAVAEADGIHPLVELLKRENVVAPHENATKALWHLASTAENQLSIAKVGGLPPLVRLLNKGSDQAAEYAAAALEALSRGCAENQVGLLRDGAIQPLIELLGSDSDETQVHALGALLNISSPNDANRNAVVRPLVSLLEVRNADAQIRAAELLAMLASKSSANCDAIFAAGAIRPLVDLLGDGRHVSGLQVRSADALCYLSRQGAHKAAIIEAGGVPPLVQMLRSRDSDGQAKASGALVHIASVTAAQPMITEAGGIGLLVALLSNERVDCQKHAAGALWHLEGARGENKAELVKCGGILPLVRILDRVESADAHESAAGVLADLAKEHEKKAAGATSSSKRAMVNLGCIRGLVGLLASGTSAAQKHASCALWGITLEARYVPEVVEREGVEALVGLLRHSGEAQGYAAAALLNMAANADARSALIRARGYEPLLAIAVEHGSGPHVISAQPGTLGEHSKTWLGTQAKDLLYELERSGDGGSAVEKALAELRTRTGGVGGGLHGGATPGNLEEDKRSKRPKTKRGASPQKKDGKASGKATNRESQTGSASHRTKKPGGKPPLSSRDSSAKKPLQKPPTTSIQSPAAAPRAASPRHSKAPSPRGASSRPSKEGTTTQERTASGTKESKKGNRPVRFTARALFPERDLSL